jgi:hypothetical protein
MVTTEKLSRKERTKNLVKQLNELSKDELLKISEFNISSISGTAYSLRNQQLIAMQSFYTETIPTVCGGFHQWKENGRKVKKGEHGFLILYPVGIKKDAQDDEEPTNFFSAVVFDISQTEELNESE